MNNKSKNQEFRIRISIFHKLMFYVAILICIAVGISTYLFVKVESRVLTDNLIHISRHMAKNIASSAKSAFWSLNWIFVERMLQEPGMSDASEIIFVQIVNPDGEIYLSDDKSCYGCMVDKTLMFELETIIDNYYFQKKQETGMLLVRPFFIKDDRWYVFLGISLNSVNKATRALMIHSAAWGGLILLFGIIGAFILSKSITKPIVRLSKSAQIISDGNLDHNVTIKSKDEIGLLGNSFNRMIKHLKASNSELKASEKKIKEYSLNLEKMVEERTSELKKALMNLQNTQSQLIQSEKMASIGQLAAGVAHEINNPVGFVKSNLGTIDEYCEDLMKLQKQYELLEKTLENGKEISGNRDIPSVLEKIQEVKDEIDLNFILDDYQKVINESVEGMERVTKIVADLKNFAHIDKGEIEHADINQGIESTLNIVWNELKYKAEVIKNLGDIPLVKCYPRRLNQVFTNILVNAAQAIEKKGEIRIATMADNGHVEIRMSDTGCGIPPEALSKIYDPFFTTKDVGKGTGLGLNVAYNIIEKHQGTIDVETEVGKGTTFIINLQKEPDLKD